MELNVDEWTNELIAAIFPIDQTISSVRENIKSYISI